MVERKFVSVDPGSTSGVIFVDVRKRRYDDLEGGPSARLREGLMCGDVIAEEFDTRRWWETGMADAIEKFMREGKGAWRDVPLVVEDFILRTADRQRTTLDPVRVTTALVSVLYDRGWRGKVVYQQPSQAKTVATDKRLRLWKIWIKGSAHKRDAMRHAVVYLRS